jgi:triacylglycerol lipase
MGTLSSRYYVKHLGGQDEVNTYVTLGGMHHGLASPCWSPVRPCVWEELCERGAFIADLNADPATPGRLRWVSMYGTADRTVPNRSSHLEGAENLEFPGVEHDGPRGLLQAPEVYAEVRRVLEYPGW